jgi:hypothetical protein
MIATWAVLGARWKSRAAMSTPAEFANAQAAEEAEDRQAGR